MMIHWELEPEWMQATISDTYVTHPHPHPQGNYNSRVVLVWLQQF